MAADRRIHAKHLEEETDSSTRNDGRVVITATNPPVNHWNNECVQISITSRSSLFSLTIVDNLSREALQAEITSTENLADSHDDSGNGRNPSSLPSTIESDRQTCHSNLSSKSGKTSGSEKTSAVLDTSPDYQIDCNGIEVSDDEPVSNMSKDSSEPMELDIQVEPTTTSRCGGKALQTASLESKSSIKKNPEPKPGASKDTMKYSEDESLDNNSPYLIDWLHTPAGKVYMDTFDEKFNRAFAELEIEEEEKYKKKMERQREAAQGKKRSGGITTRSMAKRMATDHHKGKGKDADQSDGLGSGIRTTVVDTEDNGEQGDEAIPKQNGLELETADSDQSDATLAERIQNSTQE